MCLVIQDRGRKQGGKKMENISYIALRQQIDFRSNQVQWLCEGISRVVSKLSLNCLMILIIYEISRLLRDLNKVEQLCVSCVEPECDGVLRHTQGLTQIRNCLQMMVNNKKDVIYWFLFSPLEKLTDELDNKVESYHIGSDQDLVHLVSSISSKYSK